MSATNRGSTRHKDDFYETPGWCTEALMPHLECYLMGKAKPQFLEPAAGSGAVMRVVDNYFDPGDRLHGIDINPRMRGVKAGDFLQIPPVPEYDVIITNPPYSLALEFVQRALEWRRDEYSIVAMLLRVNFLGSRKRAKWLRDHPPRLHVTPRRPCFTGDGKTDATEYAWFVWKEPFPEFSEIVILDTEDLATRSRKKKKSQTEDERKRKALAKIKLRRQIERRKKEAAMSF